MVFLRLIVIGYTVGHKLPIAYALRIHDKHVSDDRKNTQQQLNLLFASPHSR
jgi:hypothetical protein